MSSDFCKISCIDFYVAMGRVIIYDGVQYPCVDIANQNPRV